VRSRSIRACDQSRSAGRMQSSRGALRRAWDRPFRGDPSLHTGATESNSSDQLGKLAPGKPSRPQQSIDTRQQRRRRNSFDSALPKTLYGRSYNAAASATPVRRGRWKDMKCWERARQGWRALRPNGFISAYAATSWRLISFAKPQLLRVWRSRILRAFYLLS
jgi:hypothetical protein